MLFILCAVEDSLYWDKLAERVARKVYRESKGDYADVRFHRDSTGAYILYTKRWYVQTPSGYKMWYRSPVILKLPDGTPEYFENLFWKHLDRQGGWKERFGEVLASSLSCGITVAGALFFVLVSLQI